MEQPNEVQQDTHIPNLKVLPHEEVKRGTGVWPYGADTAATVSQEPQAQIRTLFRLFFKQQLWELETQHVRKWVFGQEHALVFLKGQGNPLHWAYTGITESPVPSVWGERY